MTSHGFNHVERRVNDEDEVSVVARSEAVILADSVFRVPVAAVSVEAVAGISVVTALLDLAVSSPLAVVVSIASAGSGVLQARSLSAGSRRSGVLPVAVGIIGTVELRSVVGTFVLDITTSSIPLADSVLGALVAIVGGARIFVAGVSSSANTVDHDTDVSLVTFSFGQSTAFIANSFSSPQATILVLTVSGRSDVGTVVTAAEGSVSQDGVPVAIVGRIIDARVFSGVEARTNLALISGVPNTAIVGNTTRFSGVEAELFETDSGIRGGDPVAVSRTIDVAENFSVVDGAKIVTALVVDGRPGALGIIIALVFRDVLGFASLVLAESVGGVVETFFSGGKAVS